MHQIETKTPLYFFQDGILFDDPEFPGDNDLLRVRSARHLDDLEWQRPRDFVRPDEPILVSDRNEGFDIRQGLDSWFVPAMGAIAESEALLNQVGFFILNYCFDK